MKLLLDIKKEVTAGDLEALRGNQKICSWEISVAVEALSYSCPILGPLSLIFEDNAFFVLELVAHCTDTDQLGRAVGLGLWGSAPRLLPLSAVMGNVCEREDKASPVCRAVSDHPFN